MFNNSREISQDILQDLTSELENILYHVLMNIYKIYKIRHNNNLSIDFNFGILPVTSMRDDKGYFPRGCTPQEITPITPPRHYWA